MSLKSKAIRLSSISILSLPFVMACTFQTTYERFQSSFDIYVSKGSNLSEQDTPEDKWDFLPGDKTYLIQKAESSPGRTRYYYERKFMRENEPCRYYLEVVSSTQEIVAWGLNMPLADAHKRCGFAG